MVAGMSLGGRQEAGSAHTTYASEEGVGCPPAQALGERELRSRQWIASLAEGDRVNVGPPLLPGAMGYGRSFTSCEGGERDKRPTHSCLDLVKRG